MGAGMRRLSALTAPLATLVRPETNLLTTTRLEITVR
jgi:hypothetical protein